MSWDKCLVLGKNLQKFTKFSIFFSIQKLNQSGYWGDLIIFASIEKSDMTIICLNVRSLKYLWFNFKKYFLEAEINK